MDPKDRVIMRLYFTILTSISFSSFPVNFNNTIGAVGFTSMIAPFVYPVTLIKVNRDTNEIIRDENGVCVRAKPGEYTGLFLTFWGNFWY